MASKLAQSFAIPFGTSSVLTDLTKEVLRVSTYSEDINSAEDLHAFCYS